MRRRTHPLLAQARAYHQYPRSYAFGAFLYGLGHFAIKVAVVVIVGYVILNAFGAFDAKAHDGPPPIAPAVVTTELPCQRTSAGSSCETRVERERRLAVEREQGRRALRVLSIVPTLQQR